MISMLIGKPMFSNNHVTILCGGVGYGVIVNEKTAVELHTQTEATLYVHTHVREDDLSLFGFLSAEEKTLFEELIKVSGVGPKTAISITNSSVQDLIKAVQEGEVGFFTSFSRVGKKLAQKIIIELKPRLGSLEDLDLAELAPQAQEVKDALLSLGYAEREVALAMKKLSMDGSSTTQSLIKLAMRELSQ